MGRLSHSRQHSDIRYLSMDNTDVVYVEQKVSKGLRYRNCDTTTHHNGSRRWGFGVSEPPHVPSNFTGLEDSTTPQVPLKGNLETVAIIN